MRTFSLDDLKRERRRTQMESAPRLTPEILGRIAICAITLYANARHKPVSSASLEDFFIRGLDRAPQCIRNTLHLEQSVGAVFLREGTEMALGAQRRGMAGRLNPDYNELRIKLCNMEAMTLLDQYEQEFPEAVVWIVENARRMETESPAGRAYGRPLHDF